MQSQSPATIPEIDSLTFSRAHVTANIRELLSRYQLSMYQELEIALLFLAKFFQETYHLTPDPKHANIVASFERVKLEAQLVRNDRYNAIRFLNADKEFYQMHLVKNYLRIDNLTRLMLSTHSEEKCKNFLYETCEKVLLVRGMLKLVTTLILDDTSQPSVNNIHYILQHFNFLESYATNDRIKNGALLNKKNILIEAKRIIAQPKDQWCSLTIILLQTIHRGLSSIYNEIIKGLSFDGQLLNPQISYSAVNLTAAYSYFENNAFVNEMKQLRSLALNPNQTQLRVIMSYRYVDLFDAIHYQLGLLEENKALPISSMLSIEDALDETESGPLISLNPNKFLRYFNQSNDTTSAGISRQLSVSLQECFETHLITEKLKLNTEELQYILKYLFHDAKEDVISAVPLNTNSPTSKSALSDSLGVLRDPVQRLIREKDRIGDVSTRKNTQSQPTANTPEIEPMGFLQSDVSEENGALLRKYQLNMYLELEFVLLFLAKLFQETYNLTPDPKHAHIVESFERVKLIAQLQRGVGENSNQRAMRFLNKKDEFHQMHLVATYLDLINLTKLIFSKNPAERCNNFLYEICEKVLLVRSVLKSLSSLLGSTSQPSTDNIDIILKHFDFFESYARNDSIKSGPILNLKAIAAEKKRIVSQPQAQWRNLTITFLQDLHRGVRLLYLETVKDISFEGKLINDIQSFPIEKLAATFIYFEENIFLNAKRQRKQLETNPNKASLCITMSLRYQYLLEALDYQLSLFNNNQALPVLPMLVTSEENEDSKPEPIINFYPTQFITSFKQTNDTTTPSLGLWQSDITLQECFDINLITNKLLLNIQDFQWALYSEIASSDTEPGYIEIQKLLEEKEKENREQLERTSRSMQSQSSANTSAIAPLVIGLSEAAQMRKNMLQTYLELEIAVLFLAKFFKEFYQLTPDPKHKYIVASFERIKLKAELYRADGNKFKTAGIKFLNVSTNSTDECYQKHIVITYLNLRNLVNLLLAKNSEERCKNFLYETCEKVLVVGSMFRKMYSLSNHIPRPLINHDHIALKHFHFFEFYAANDLIKDGPLLSKDAINAEKKRIFSLPLHQWHSMTITFLKDIQKELYKIYKNILSGVPFKNTNVDKLSPSSDIATIIIYIEQDAFTKVNNKLYEIADHPDRADLCQQMSLRYQYLLEALDYQLNLLDRNQAPPTLPILTILEDKEDSKSEAVNRDPSEFINIFNQSNDILPSLHSHSSTWLNDCYDSNLIFTKLPQNINEFAAVLSQEEKAKENREQPERISRSTEARPERSSQMDMAAVLQQTIARISENSSLGAPIKTNLRDAKKTVGDKKRELSKSKSALAEAERRKQSGKKSLRVTEQELKIVDEKIADTSQEVKEGERKKEEIEREQAENNRKLEEIERKKQELTQKLAMINQKREEAGISAPLAKPASMPTSSPSSVPTAASVTPSSASTASASIIPSSASSTPTAAPVTPSSASTVIASAPINPSSASSTPTAASVSTATAMPSSTPVQTLSGASAASTTTPPTTSTSNNITSASVSTATATPSSSHTQTPSGGSAASTTTPEIKKTEPVSLETQKMNAVANTLSQYAALLTARNQLRDEFRKELRAYSSDNFANKKSFPFREKIMDDIPFRCRGVKILLDSLDSSKLTMNDLSNELSSIDSLLDEIKASILELKKNLKFNLDRARKSQGEEKTKETKETKEEKKEVHRIPYKRTLPAARPPASTALQKPAKPIPAADTSEFKATEPLRIQHLNQAVKNLILLPKILAHHEAKVTHESKVIHDEITHFALLYNIFRCFQSLKMYQAYGGRKQTIDNDLVVDLRNMLIHYGIAAANLEAVIDFAKKMQHNMPQVICDLTPYHLIEFELSETVRQELIIEFGLVDKKPSPWINPGSLILEDKELYILLRRFHAGKTENKVEFNDYEVIQNYYKPLIHTISEPLFTKLWTTDQHQFVEANFLKLLALRMLVTNCGELGAAFMDKKLPLSNFLKFCHYNIRNSVGHNLNDMDVSSLHEFAYRLKDELAGKQANAAFFKPNPKRYKTKNTASTTATTLNKPGNSKTNN